jgi:hypothetical protein
MAVPKLRLVAAKLARRGNSASSGKPPDVDWTALVDPFMWGFYNDPNKGSKRYGSNRRQGVFHPSAGLSPERGGCERMMVLDLICAPRSPQRVSASQMRCFHNGHDRHAGLHSLFKDMAGEKYGGIIRYDHDVPCEHDTLPIAGEVDGIVHFDNGHHYVLDFKTIGDNPSKKMMGVETDQKYYYQLNTYLGLLGEKTGYLVFENKSSQNWLGPWERFRLDFDAKAFKITEDYCIYIMGYVKRRQLPVFNQRVCSENIKFCAYSTTCEKARLNKLRWEQFDCRPPALITRYWNS